MYPRTSKDFIGIKDCPDQLERFRSNRLGKKLPSEQPIQPYRLYHILRDYSKFPTVHW